MMIRFSQRDVLTQGFLKVSSTDNTKVPNKWNKVVIMNTTYLVADVIFNYDNGVVDVKLINI